jgi:hypothetical protein
MNKFPKVKLIKKQVNNTQTNYSNGYWLEGELLSKLEVNSKIIVLRDKRADYDDYSKEVIIDGLFTSSIIREIKSNIITTQNSVWEIVWL